MVILALLISTIFNSSVFGSVIKDGPQPPTTYSQSIVVMDEKTGQILYEKGGDIQCMPASTTKVMTAILAFENLDLDSMVTVGAKPPYAEGSSMGFKEGEIVMVRDLLYALLLHSANDAAEILAEAVSGSTEEFAKLMNEKAVELGTTNTTFVNPSGLTGEVNNLTTAKDLAIITAAAAEIPELLEISQTLSYKLPFTNLVTDTNRWATNKNSLMIKSSEYYYEPIILGKTGWTSDAGYAFTSVGEKDGQRIIVSMLKSVNQGTYWKETKELMEWAFNNFNISKLYEKDQNLKKVIAKNGDEIDLVADKDFYYIGVKGLTNQTPHLEFNEELAINGSFKAGEIIDTAKVILDGSDIGLINLVAKTDISLEDEDQPIAGEPSTNPANLTPVKKAASYAIGIFLLFTLVIITIRFINRSKQRKMRKRTMSAKRLEYYKNRDNFNAK
ncbi:MAG: D-alanyl-D-alanine carboxypeptidase family protein [Clostridiaceae bacterium]